MRHFFMFSIDNIKSLVKIPLTVVITRVLPVWPPCLFRNSVLIPEIPKTKINLCHHEISLIKLSKQDSLEFLNKEDQIVILVCARGTPQCSTDHGCFFAYFDHVAARPAYLNHVLAKRSGSIVVYLFRWLRV